MVECIVNEPRENGQEDIRLDRRVWKIKSSRVHLFMQKKMIVRCLKFRRVGYETEPTKLIDTAKYNSMPIALRLRSEDARKMRMVSGGGGAATGMAVHRRILQLVFVMMRGRSSNIQEKGKIPDFEEQIPTYLRRNTYDCHGVAR